MFWQAVGYGLLGTIALIVLVFIPVLVNDFMVHQVVPTKYRCSRCGEAWPDAALRDKHQEFCDLMPF